MKRPLAIGVMGIAFALACGGGSTSTGGQGDLGTGGSSGSNGGSGSGGDMSSNGGNSNGGNSSSGSYQGSNSSSGGSQSSSSSGSNSSSGSSSGGSSSSSGGSSSGSGASPTMLPAVSGTCPTITGANATTLTFAGEPVEVWAGTGGGPLVLYWYPTGGSSAFVLDEFGQTNISAVTAAGGVVASFAKSNGTGTDTGDAVWFTGDFTTADQVVACAIQQLHIDTRRIFVTGASAGGLQTTWMSYARSGYVAAAVTLSGGLEEVGGFSGTPTTLQDPTNVPAAMAVHGAPGVDVVVIDFSVASAAWEADVAMKGGFSMDCNTGGGHVSGPPQILPGMWQFMVDHPFKVAKEPYPPIPSVFPSYCQIGPRAADGGAP